MLNWIRKGNIERAMSQNFFRTTFLGAILLLLTAIFSFGGSQTEFLAGKSYGGTEGDFFVNLNLPWLVGDIQYSFAFVYFPDGSFRITLTATNDGNHEGNINESFWMKPGNFHWVYGEGDSAISFDYGADQNLTISTSSGGVAVEMFTVNLKGAIGGDLYVDATGSKGSVKYVGVVVYYKGAALVVTVVPRGDGTYEVTKTEIEYGADGKVAKACVILPDGKKVCSDTDKPGTCAALCGLLPKIPADHTRARALIEKAIADLSCDCSGGHPPKSPSAPE